MFIVISFHCTTHSHCIGNSSPTIAVEMGARSARFDEKNRILFSVATAVKSLITSRTAKHSNKRLVLKGSTGRELPKVGSDTENRRPSTPHDVDSAPGT